MLENFRHVFPLLLPWIGGGLVLVLVFPSLAFSAISHVLPILLPGQAFEIAVGGRYLRGRRFPRLISAITFISISGVTLGVMALIIVIGVMNGFEADLKKKILGVNAHVVVLSSTGFTFDEYRRVAAEAAEDPEVLWAAPFVLSQAMLGSASSVQGVIVRGLDTESPGQLGDLVKNLQPGESLGAFTAPAGGGPPPLVVGVELSRALGIAPGDRVRLISPFGSTTPGGVAPGMETFLVAGIFKSGMFEYDSNLVYVPLPAAQRFFDIGDNATGVEVKLVDFDRSREAAARLQERLGDGYWTRDWTEMNHALFSALKLEKIAMFIILTLIVFVASFNIVSSLIMKVMERHKDIAILKSMGATSGQILRIFVFGGFMIGAVGTLLGIILGWGACLALDRYKFISLPSSVYYIETLPVQVNGPMIALIAGAAMLITLGATLYPAWKAARLDPIPALRYE